MAESEQTDIDQTPQLTVPAEIRFKRFLYLGQEIPKYFPGDWRSHKYYVPQMVPSLQELVADTEKCKEVVEIVLQTYKNDSYSRLEALLFALAMCLKFGNEDSRKPAFDAVKTICKQTEQLMLFMMLHHQLQIGTGAGWRRFITDWYNKRTPVQLAREFARYISRHGFSHKDIMKLAHIKPGEDIARQCVYSYVFVGYKKTQELFGSKPEAIEVLKICKNIEEYKVCENVQCAVFMTKLYGYTFDHVPVIYNSNQEIWNLVIPYLSPSQMLGNIQRVHDLGFLAEDSTTQKALQHYVVVLIDTIKFPELNAPRDSPLQLHPIVVYIAQCNYKSMGRPRSFNKQKVLQEKEEKRLSREAIAKVPNLTGKQKKLAESQLSNDRKKGKSIKPNAAIIKSLDLLMAQTWQLSVATGHRYMITMDMRDYMFKGNQFCDRRVFEKRIKGPAKPGFKVAELPTPESKESDNKTSNKDKYQLAECFHNRNVVAGHAAIILAQQILYREKDVTLAVFTDDGVQCVDLGTKGKVASLETAETKLRGVKLGKSHLAAPMDWAAANNKPIDVFINIVDSVSRAIYDLPKLIRPGVPRPSKNDLKLIEKVQKSKKSTPGTSEPCLPSPPPTAPVEPVEECPVRALLRYRQQMKLEDAKLITLSLISKNFCLNDGQHEGVLDIVGLDEHTPTVIDAFCRNHFK